jgi:hypothetical protein
MDPRIRIRIHPKMSWIRNTGIKDQAFRLNADQDSVSGFFSHPESRISKKSKKEGAGKLNLLFSDGRQGFT